MFANLPRPHTQVDVIQLVDDLEVTIGTLPHMLVHVSKAQQMQLTDRAGCPTVLVVV